MENNSKNHEGIKLLLQKCRNEFRRAENIDFYADEDYKEAKRKFVKFCLFNETWTWIKYSLFHGFDPATPMEETLGALETLIQQSLVRYVGVFNWSAWPQIAQ